MTDDKMRELLKEYHKKSLDFAISMIDEAENAAKDQSFKYAAAYLTLAAAADPTRSLGSNPQALDD